MRTVTLDGRTYQMRDVNRLYQEQRAELARRQDQPTLFEVHQDLRPKAHKTAAGRFQHPTLFD
jgi:hypothetical protein